MATLRLTLEYDGAAFCGWATQPQRRSVQAVLDDAISRLWPEAMDVAVAGRTDAGVHASGQIVSLRVSGGLPIAQVPEALNELLPADVSVRDCVVAADGFNARFSALARVYEYRVLRSRRRSPMRAARTFHHPRPIDLDLLDAGAALAVGSHDFRAFTPSETQHSVFRRNVVNASWTHGGEESVLVIEANSFLRHMVRILVGSMLWVAAGSRPLDWLAGLLDGADRSQAGPTAPANALCLVAVRYPADGDASVSAELGDQIAATPAIQGDSSSLPPQAMVGTVTRTEPLPTVIAIALACRQVSLPAGTSL